MDVFMDNAKVMSKGQITIPKDVRDALGVSSGDRVTFIVEGRVSAWSTRLSTQCRCSSAK